MAARKRGLKIQSLIARSGIVDELQLRSAVARSEQWGTRLPQSILDLNFCSESELMEALSQQIGMPVTYLTKAPRDSAALSKLAPEYCKEQGVFPMQLKGRVLTMAMADPTELDLIDEIQQRTNCRVQPMLSSESDVQNAIKREYIKMRVNTGESPTSAMPRKSVEFHMPGENQFEFDGGKTAEMQAFKPPKKQKDISEYLSVSPLADNAIYSPEEMARLSAIQVNQAKTQKIYQAVTELLTEKGVLP